MPTEIQIYLAKFLPEPRRGEPRNFGLVVRTANDDVFFRFILEDGPGENLTAIPRKLDFVACSKEIKKWKDAVDKYGVKALHWIGKRKSFDQKFYLEFVGGDFVQELDLDGLFKELVG